MYEVLPTEPLHDMKEHICNVVSELKHHLSQEEKQLCEKTIELVAETKEQLRGSDYREMAIVLSKQLRGLQQLYCTCMDIIFYSNVVFLNTAIYCYEQVHTCM